MASRSSSSVAGHVAGSPFTFSITETLSKNNLGLWKLQVLPAIRGAQLEIDIKDANGKIVKGANPAYSTWMAQGQQVLGYLLSTMIEMSWRKSPRPRPQPYYGLQQRGSSPPSARLVN